MKYFIYILVLLLITLNVKSQNLKLSMEVGVGLYKLDGLKSINELILEDLPFTGKQVTDFPASLYYRPAISVQYSRVTWGVIYSYMSTGSRISTKDYSGEYRFDMVSTTQMPAIHIDAKVSEDKKIATYLRLQTGISLSHLIIDEYFNINESVLIEDDLKLKSTNYFLEPSIYFTYPLKSFLIESHFGYSLSMGENTLTDSSGDIELTNPTNGNAISPDWSGLRIGIGIAYVFKR